MLQGLGGMRGGFSHPIFATLHPHPKATPMTLARVLSATVFAFVLMSPSVGALSATSAVQAEASPAKTADLAARDTWQGAQAVLKLAVTMEILPQGSDTPKSLLMLIERTPHGRLEMVVRDPMAAEAPTITYLIHDGDTMQLIGDEVFRVPAPWMVGYDLFDQVLEPIMLVNWTLGLPGKDFSIEPELANVALDDDRLVYLEQSDWRVDYPAWTAAQNDRPALPQQVVLRGQQVTVRMTIASVEAFAQAPKGYVEFSLQ